MNRFFSSLIIFSMVAQPFAEVAQSLPAPVPAASATPTASINAPFVEDHTFQLTQENQVFELEHKEMEPIFETQSVPDTCYQSVQRGTKKECHTEYDESCSTRMENECQNVPYPVCQMIAERICEEIPRRSCQTVNETVCQTVNDSVCHTENQNVCTNVPRQVCRDEVVCRTEYDDVCDPNPTPGGPRSGPTRGDAGGSSGGTRGGSSGTRGSSGSRGLESTSCRKVPRKVCETKRVCETKNEQVCRSEPRQVCTNLPRRECRTEPRQQCSTTYDSVCHTENRQRCHDEYRQECQMVPRQSCVDVPREVCEQVPNMVSEPYACTRDVQVQVGERTKKQISANVKVNVANFGKFDVNQDEFNVKIDVSAAKANVTLKPIKPSTDRLYRLVKKDLVVQSISDVAQRVAVVFTIEVISLKQLREMSELKISEPKLGYEKLQFKLSHPSLGSDLSSLVSMEKGALEVVMVKGRRLYTIIDDAFDPALVLKKTDDGFEIPLSAFDIRYLKGRSHRVRLELRFKSTLNRSEFLNPEALTTVSIKPVVGEFEAFPTE